MLSGATSYDNRELYNNIFLAWARKFNPAALLCSQLCQRTPLLLQLAQILYWPQDTKRKVGKPCSLTPSLPPKMNEWMNEIMHHPVGLSATVSFGSGKIWFHSMRHILVTRMSYLAVTLQPQTFTVDYCRISNWQENKLPKLECLSDSRRNLADLKSCFVLASAEKRHALLWYYFMKIALVQKNVDKN